MTKTQSKLQHALDQFNLKNKNCADCDASCGFCKKHHKIWDNLMKKFGDDLD
jgi:hypothetical protein